MSIPNYREGTPEQQAAYWMGFLDGGSRLFMEVSEGVKDNPWISPDEQTEILATEDWFYETYGKRIETAIAALPGTDKENH